jgi:hypothetical protein
MLVRCFLALLFLWVASCHSRSEIVGQWESRLDTIEFFDDGSWSIELRGVGSIAGQWVILDDGRVKLSYSSLGSTHQILGRLEEDKLIMERDLRRGKNVEFRRVTS